MEAAEQLAKSIDIEVLDLLSLNPLDLKAIVTSVKKTGRCLIAHEAPKTQGFGAELAALVMENCFLNLQAPVRRCCGLDTPFPHTLEKEYLPDACRVVNAAQELMRY